MNSKDLFYNTKPARFNKCIEVPTSKSSANRALIVAAISNKPIIIKSIPRSSDVLNLINCLIRVGLSIEIKDDTLKITNSFPECEIETNDVVVLETGDGGTTNRFLIPLLALGKNRYELRPSEKMLERPMEEIVTVLKSLGVDIHRSEGVWFSLQGPYVIDRHVVEVDCSRSTQFATGLALSLSKLQVDVQPINLKSSRPYWDMTKHIIETLKESMLFTVPVDFSSLSYPLALAALDGELLVKNCKGIDYFQADSVLVKILKSLNVYLKFNADGFHVKGLEELQSFEYDCKDCPDLVPTLCFLGSYAKGKTTLYNIDVLRFKECDRLKEMMRILELFNVKHSYDIDEDCLTIEGGSPSNEVVNYDPPVDHRMVMIGYLFQRVNGGGQLSNCSAVQKSFTNFFEIME